MVPDDRVLRRLFFLLYVLFTKLFPIVSIWEVQEGREAALKEAEGRIKTYLPVG